MSIREKLKKKNTHTVKINNLEPIWVHAGTEATKELYAASLNEYLRVKEFIKTGKANRPKANWLVRAAIASQAGFDRSLISSRRQPSLCDWIEQKNHELEELYNVYKTPIRAVEKKTKRDLEKELSILRKKLAEHVESDRRAIVEVFFNSNMLDDRDTLRRQNSRLKSENSELMDKNARLQGLLHNSEEKAAQLMEVLTYEQRMMLGWRPRSK